jgi:hypothetical protein
LEEGTFWKLYAIFNPTIYDFENLHEAYLSARKNKRYRGDVLEFTNTPGKRT